MVGCFDISYCVDDMSDVKGSGGDATKDLGNAKLAHHHVLNFSGCPTTHLTAGACMKACTPPS